MAKVGEMVRQMVMQADKTKRGWMTEIAKEVGCTRQYVWLVASSITSKEQKKKEFERMQARAGTYEEFYEELFDDFSNIVKGSKHSMNSICRACGFLNVYLSNAIRKRAMGLDRMIKVLACFGKKLVIVDVDEERSGVEK